MSRLEDVVDGRNFRLESESPDGLCLSLARLARQRGRRLDFRGRNRVAYEWLQQVDQTARIELERRPRRFMIDGWKRLLRLRAINQFRGVRSGWGFVCAYLLIRSNEPSQTHNRQSNLWSCVSKLWTRRKTMLGSSSVVIAGLDFGAGSFK